MTIEIKDPQHVYGDGSDYGPLCAACIAHPELGDAIQAALETRENALTMDRDEAKAKLEKTLAFQKDLISQAVEHAKAGNIEGLSAVIAEAQKPELDRQRDALDAQIAALSEQRRTMG